MTSATATKYDVFLSFRGPDTRRTFISFLYKELVRRNIRTFKDDEDLENGQMISPELKRAIEESRFAVVVVSVNYAASSWCLDELVEIMDFQKNKGSITVMPVFYGVDPCHLRRQIGEVAKQFKKHESREDHEKVLSWRQALTDLANISGECSLNWEDDSKLVDVIADKISKELMIVIHRESEIKMTCATATKYDVFLSFRGLDTRRTFISFLYQELVRMNIRTFKDDKELKHGRRNSPELKQAIEESRFAVVVFSENYAASPWCLDELVKIMDFENKGSITVMPIFYGVDPCHLRRQSGDVAEQFKKHEAREEDLDKVASWRRALAAFAQLSGDCSGDDDSKLIDKIDHEIFKKKTIFAKISNGRNLVGIDTHMKELNRLMDFNSNKGVRMVGIWARGGEGRSALAKYVYQDICQHFESHCFLGNVKTISQGRHSAHLHHEFLQNIQRENPNKQTLKNQKVLLVVDDVDKLKQLEALAEDFNGFGPGSVVIITTHDKQLLISYGIKLVYEVEL